MAQLYRKLSVSKEMKAAFFMMAFMSIFIIAQFAVGFQLVLFVIAMTASVGLILWQPRAGLYAMIALTVFFERFYTLQPLMIGRASSYKLYPIDIFIVAIIVSLILRSIPGKVSFWFKKVDVLFVLFVSVVTLLFARDSFGFGDKSLEVALSTWKSYVFYGLLYFIVPMLISSKESLIRLVKFYFGASVAAIAFVLIGIVRGEGFWTEYTPLSTSGVRILAFPHAYYFSLAILMGLYSAKYWLSSSKVMRRCVYGIISLWIVGIFGSLMRHLWLGLGASLFVMLFFVGREYKRSILNVSRILAVMACAVFVIFFYVVALFPRSDVSEQTTNIAATLSERFVSIGNSGDESIAWRGVVWRNALHAFSGNVLLGTGLGTSVPVEIGEYREFVEIRNIHNSWLALLVQTGIVGFGVFAAFLGTLFFSVWKNRRIDKDTILETAKYATMGILIFQSIIFLSQPYLETNLLSLFFWINLGVMRSLLDYEHS